MDLHGVKEGDHKRAAQKTLYDPIKASNAIITF